MLKLLFTGCFCFVTIVSSSQNNSLILNGAYVILKGDTINNPVYFIIDQNSTSGIIRPGGGHIHSEDQYSFIKWNTGIKTGNYIFPFGVNGFSAKYIPFTFNKTSTENSDITVSTWATTIQNLPHPGISNVAAVSSMTCTADSVKSAIDRFWDIRSSGNVTANLTFSYLGSENTTNSPLGIFKAQHWNGTQWDSQAGPGNMGITTSIGTVGPVIGQTTFSPWVLTKIPTDVMATAHPSTICNGASSTLTATGATNFSWTPSNSLNSGTGPSVTATPSVTTTYTVTGTNINGCTDTATITVVVNPLPAASAGYPSTICSGSNVSIGATGVSGNTYSWVSNPAGFTSTLSKPTVSPVVTTTYTLTERITATGCTKSNAVTIKVNQLPIANAGPDQTVYYGYPPKQCATLSGSATGGSIPYNYSWSNGATTASTFACPTSTTTYYLTVTGLNGCPNPDNVTVKVFDIRCEKNKVKLCHNNKTICVSISDVQDHLVHGDHLGACGTMKLLNLDSVETENPMTLYPNPGTGLFSLEICKNNVVEDAKIEVVNSVGQVVFSKTAFKIDGCIKETIELQRDLLDGMYFLHLIIGYKVETRKLILIK